MEYGWDALGNQRRERDETDVCERKIIAKSDWTTMSSEHPLEKNGL